MLPATKAFGIEGPAQQALADRVVAAQDGKNAYGTAVLGGSKSGLGGLGLLAPRELPPDAGVADALMAP